MPTTARFHQDSQRAKVEVPGFCSCEGREPRPFTSSRRVTGIPHSSKIDIRYLELSLFLQPVFLDFAEEGLIANIEGISRLGLVPFRLAQRLRNLGFFDQYHRPQARFG